MIHFILFALLLVLFNSNVFTSGAVEEISISLKLKEKILSSTFKANIQTKDGGNFVAYLYAEDEQSELIEDDSRITGKSKEVISKTGHYYIYLYNITSGSFLDKRTKIFDGEDLRFNVEGASIIVLASHKQKKSDILLISQFGDSNGDFFEAYGFFGDNFQLKNYIFHLGKKKGKMFYGTIAPDDGSTKLHCSVFNFKRRDVDQYILYLARNGEVMFQPSS